ncbi:MAG: flagellar hook-associated protein FlgK [Defluviitaleaceae bacterium]|nr:flagellar hook-associated protein FlgK [Defluviitaleaceae bacterium]MCL2273330.1 flagellar hook-associated protein FlgK [Defluviitaleaceae bacterium]
MRSAFFPFHIATTGLHAARANLNVVSHNVANAEIPGFSRQQTVQSAARPLHVWDGRGMYGTGSETHSIIQNRNRFLDMKFWHQRAIMGEHATKVNHLTFVETVFNNLPGAGVLSSFEQFFGRMQDLSSNAADETFRTNVINGSAALTEMVRHNALALQRQQMDLNREIADVVMIINSLGQQISTLNRQIADFERDGSNANDLRDRRNLLIDQLSQHVNVEVQERDFSTPDRPNDRRLTVLINGHDFVRHDRHSALELIPRQAGERRNEMDVDGLYDVYFSGGMGAFDIYNHALRGTLRGLIDLRDGNNSVVTNEQVAYWPMGFLTNAPDQWRGDWLDAAGNVVPEADRALAVAGFNPNDPVPHDPNGFRPAGTQVIRGTTSNFKGIPFYMNQLNTLVRTFARAINEGLDAQMRPIPGTTGHINGYDRNGDNRSALLFTYRRDSDGEIATFNTFGDNPNVPPGNTRWVPIYVNAAGQRFAGAPIPAIPGEAPITIPSGFTPLEDDRGYPMFTMYLGGMNALNFSINPELVHSNQLLATSTSRDIGESNNEVIIGFNTVGTFPHLFREGRLEDFIISVSDHLAIDTRQALNFALSFDEITTQTHNQRLSVKGVDINEEMMDLVRFQTMFQAASRLINVIDSIYDTLVNRLGAF